MLGMLFLISSCQFSDKYKLINTEVNLLLKNNLRPEKEILFVLTEYDCEVCVNSLPFWFDKIRNHITRIQTYGVYYNTSRFFTYEHYVNSEDELISWQQFSNSELLENIATLSPKMKGPYAIFIINQKVVNIYPVNDFNKLNLSLDDLF